MLAAVAAELREVESVVTFFGKTFDRHRLEDKFAMHRMKSNFPAERHADLYHITRARFGWKLSDVKLRTVEESLLGFRREGDLPGSEAPRAYFDYLAGRPSLLARVFEHNEADVRSLVFLYVRCAAPFESAHALECLAAAKGAAALGEWNTTLQFAARARGDPRAEPAASSLLYEVTKKLGDVGAAREHLERLSAGGRAEFTFELARRVYHESDGCNEALRLLSLADAQASALPAGSALDALRVKISKLRWRLAPRSMSSEES